MTRFGIAAIGAAIALSACASPEITSRADTAESLYLGFGAAESYTPRPIGARSQNDFMRFSTMGPQ